MDLDVRLRRAVEQFWHRRSEQHRKQVERGRSDAGTRGSVTGGTHMEGLEALVIDLLIQAGLQTTDVKSRTGIELPGNFRPEKKWDLVAVSSGRLVAAIEFKSMVGSFGNNFNNRVEEAIGNAQDVWVAFREGRFGTSPSPFLGYFFLLQDVPAVHRPLRESRTPGFPIDPIFQGSSYARRYEILCRRLIRERLYTSACLVLSTENAEISQPAADLTIHRFAAALKGHVVSFLGSP